MSKRRLNWSAAAVAGALLASLIPLAAGSPAAAADETEVGPIQQTKTDLARQLRLTATDRVAGPALFNALINDGVVDPATVFAKSGSAAGAEFTRLAAAADAGLKDFLGLTTMTDSTLAVYLADQDGQLAKGVPPLFAAAPEEDVEAGTLTAETLDGKQVTVDLAETPPAPMIMVTLNMENITPQAMYAVSAALNASGVLSDVLVPVDPPKSTRLDRIRLKNVEEPGAGKWWCPGSLCDAEVFVIAMGGSNGQPRADVVPLYEVNVPNKTYYPFKTIVSWDRFSWSKIDLLIMEKDATGCQAPYSKYGTAVAGAITSLASGPTYVPLNTAAREALKDKSKICSWPLSYTVNPPDYIDRFDGVTQGFVNDRTGASNNANVFTTLITI